MECDHEVHDQRWKTFPYPSSPEALVSLQWLQNAKVATRVVLVVSVEKKSRHTRRHDAPMGAEKEPLPGFGSQRGAVEGTGELRTSQWQGTHFISPWGKKSRG